MRRRGRPGLVGTMARTAVITGTATTVAGAAADRRAQQQMQAQPMPAQPVPVHVAPPPPAAADDPIARLEQLADLKVRGLLTEDEFSAMKAKLLGL